MYFTDAMLQQNCFSVNIFKLEIYGENPVRAAPRVGTVPVIGCPLDPLVIGPITQPVPLIGSDQSTCPPDRSVRSGGVSGWRFVGLL
jgi:hypothetical protein